MTKKMRVRAVMAVAVLAMGAAGVWAQQPAQTQATAARRESGGPAPMVPDTRQGPILLRTFHLANVVQQNEANEMQMVLRNMLDPHDKLYLVGAQNAIVVEAPQADLDTVAKVLAELDKPKKTYRLTYTVTEKDGDKRLGTQHFSMIVVAGQRTVMKQGSKIPISTGAGLFSYQDIGMNFDVSLDEFANGVRLRSNVQQTSVPEEKQAGSASQPVIRQTALEGTAFLAPGKPMMLGSLDVPGSTRHLDIEVVMEQAL